MDRKKLGRGLDSLMPAADEARRDEVLYLRPDEIVPNPSQPRKDFPKQEIAELASSLQEHGILQPVIVRRLSGDQEGGRYELIAGERRLRASKLAGVETIPAIVHEVSDSRMLEISLIENIQRQDLNPIEMATAYKELTDRMHLTQEEAARRVGKDRSSVANTIRLLELPDQIQKSVSRGTISMGHARALLGIADPARQLQLARQIEKEGLSVRQIEETVATTRKATPRSTRGVKAPHIRQMEDRLRQSLGTRVTITGKNKRGKITIEFYSNDDFERILQKLT